MGHRSSPEQELLQALRAGVADPGPGPLLAVGGLLLAAAGADEADGSLDDLVESLTGAGRLETWAAVLTIAVLTGDTELRRRARRELADRGQVLPRWLAELDRSEPVDRAVEVSTVFRVADDLLVGVTVPGGHPLTAVVHVVNEIGAVATDGYVLHSPIESVVALMAEDDDPDVRTRDIPAADARARILAALDELDTGPGRLGTSADFEDTLPVLEWMVSLLPDGGDASVLRDLSDAELEELAEAFLATPSGTAWRDEDLRLLVEEVLAAASAHGVGDPLLWAPHHVHELLDPDGWRLGRRTPRLDRIPDLLRDLIPYGHTERGLRRQVTDEALAAVDDAEGNFLEGLRRADEDPG